MTRSAMARFSFAGGSATQGAVARAALPGGRGRPLRVVRRRESSGADEQLQSLQAILEGTDRRLLASTDVEEVLQLGQEHVVAFEPGGRLGLFLRLGAPSDEMSDSVMLAPPNPTAGAGHFDPVEARPAHVVQLDDTADPGRQLLDDQGDCIRFDFELGECGAPRPSHPSWAKKPLECIHRMGKRQDDSPAQVRTGAVAPAEVLPGMPGRKMVPILCGGSQDSPDGICLEPGLDGLQPGVKAVLIPYQDPTLAGEGGLAQLLGPVESPGYRFLQKHVATCPRRRNCHVEGGG